jgi:hypothetical protein
MRPDKINKKKVTITLDQDIVNRLNQANVKVSTIINNLLRTHLSLYSKPKSQNLITPRSLVQIQPSLFKGVFFRETDHNSRLVVLNIRLSSIFFY